MEPGGVSGWLEKMLTLAFISLAIFLAYVTYALLKIRCIPASLSDTYYLLGNTPLFTVALFAMALTILPSILSVTPSNWQVVAFLCPAAIGFVGAAPQFKGVDSAVHKISALVSAACGILWALLLSGSWWTVPASVAIAAGLAYLTKTLKGSKVWWLEMVAFMSVYSSLIIALL